MRGLIYRNALTYELSMALLYGRQHSARYRAIADLIRPGATVLELCCGPGILYRRYLRDKCIDYLGIDVNTEFISRVIRSGGKGKVRDLRINEPLPNAEYVIMQGSLYHFLPDPYPVFMRMFAAATKRMIVAEPVHNLANSRVPFVRPIVGLLTDPGVGNQEHRFTEQSLDQFVGELQLRFDVHSVSEGREKLYVFNK